MPGPLGHPAPAVGQKVHSGLRFLWNMCLNLWLPEDWPERDRNGALKLGDHLLGSLISCMSNKEARWAIFRGLTAVRSKVTLGFTSLLPFRLLSVPQTSPGVVLTGKGHARLFPTQYPCCSLLLYPRNSASQSILSSDTASSPCLRSHREDSVYVTFVLVPGAVCGLCASLCLARLVTPEYPASRRQKSSFSFHFYLQFLKVAEDKYTVSLFKRPKVKVSAGHALPQPFGKILPHFSLFLEVLIVPWFGESMASISTTHYHCHHEVFPLVCLYLWTHIIAALPLLGQGPTLFQCDFI